MCVGIHEYEETVQAHRHGGFHVTSSNNATTIPCRRACAIYNGLKYIAQYIDGKDAFGVLNTDGARLRRLFFQPVLIAWALWSTGAWKAWRSSKNSMQ